MPTDLPERVSEFFNRHSLDRGTGVVAVSGGPDSVALFRLLQGRVGRLIVAHVNHQLRGDESDGDQAFVESLARQHDAAVLCARIDTKATAESTKDNLENCARRLRYEHFINVAKSEKATWIATGHTADDQAETVLHRLIRGTGVQGLVGIRECRELTPGMGLVRPLLTTRRAEVVEYLESLKQPYRVDSSNTDFRFTRNRIRHELLPQLARDYSPAIVETLCSLAKQAAEQSSAQRAAAAELVREAELPRAGTVLVFQRERLAKAERNRVREALRLIWEREGWPQGDMTFEAWDRLAGLAAVEAKSMDLPGGIHARSKGHVVQLERAFGEPGA